MPNRTATLRMCCTSLRKWWCGKQPIQASRNKCIHESSKSGGEVKVGTEATRERRNIYLSCILSPTEFDRLLNMDPSPGV